MDEFLTWLTLGSVRVAIALPVVIAGLLLIIVWGRSRSVSTFAGELRPFRIFMPLRGADPFLADAVRSVLAQDYPQFSLHVVIDSVTDPAWAIVDEVRRQHPGAPIEVEELREQPPTRSLYCSGLTQFLQRVDDADWITFVAADMVVPRHWLREMGTALLDPKVGGTLGNRWFIPPRGQMGSLVRYWWNAFAFVHMWLHEVVWGGTLAMRAGDVRLSGLADRWARGMIEDVPSWTAIRSVGLKFQQMPDMVIVNHEEIGVAGAFRFTHRQMQWDRLYHPRWWQGFVMGWMSGMILLGLTLQGIGSALAGDGRLFLIGQSAHACVVLASVGFVVALDRIVTRGYRQWGGPGTPWTATRLLKLAATVHLAVLATVVGSLRCLIIREVVWRGVVYRIHGPFDVERVSSEDWPARMHQAALSGGESME